MVRRINQFTSKAIPVLRVCVLKYFFNPYRTEMSALTLKHKNNKTFSKKVFSEEALLLPYGIGQPEGNQVSPVAPWVHE